MLFDCLGSKYSERSNFRILDDDVNTGFPTLGAQGTMGTQDKGTLTCARQHLRTAEQSLLALRLILHFFPGGSEPVRRESSGGGVELTQCTI